MRACNTPIVMKRALAGGGELPSQRTHMRALLAATVAVLGVLALASPLRAREVHLATLVWEPYYGPELRDDGFCGAIAKAAFERAGHSLTITYLPWARALRDAAAGRFDGLLGGYYTESRAEDFYFTREIAEARGALIATPEVDIDHYESLRELTGYKIAVGNDFAHNEAFDAADYLAKLEVNRVSQMVHMLFNRRVDMAAMSVAVFRHEARELGYTNISRMKLIDPPLFRNGLFVLMSKAIEGGKALRDDFNEGLSAIKADGTYREIRRRYGQAGS